MNAKVPWLGYSPDDGVFLWAASAVAGNKKSSGLKDIQHSRSHLEKKKLPYIVHDGENYSLRPTHAYNLQVQLGLFLLELDNANLLVYSQEESLVILVRWLHYVYFKHYLPHIIRYGK